jgi:hypothetical protein
LSNSECIPTPENNRTDANIPTQANYRQCANEDRTVTAVARLTRFLLKPLLPQAVLPSRDIEKLGRTVKSLFPRPHASSIISSVDRALLISLLAAANRSRENNAVKAQSNSNHYKEYSSHQGFKK